MKHKNLKLKKACFILTASISLYAYARYEHIYNPNYTITEEEPYFATYSNGDMVIETTACPSSPIRMFYGIKENGRSFFDQTTGNIRKTNYYSIEPDQQAGNDGKKKYESDIA